MFEKTEAVGMCLMLLCGTSTAQTIDEIVDLNRQAAIAEAKSKVETAKKAGVASAPAAPSGPSGSASALPLPPGAPAAPPLGWKITPAKKTPPPPPALLAIYGVGYSLVAELSENGTEGRYREGDKTPGGWTVSRIDKRKVDITRQGAGKRKAPKLENVTLAFGNKVDVPMDMTYTPREQAPGNYSVPPLPSSFSASRPN